MNALAERYVKLVLALGQHDADYVDAYYGPPEWRKDGRGARSVRSPRSTTEAATLQQALAAAAPPPAAEEMRSPPPHVPDAGRSRRCARASRC